MDKEEFDKAMDKQIEQFLQWLRVQRERDQQFDAEWIRNPDWWKESPKDGTS